jgi:hypothetical protein
VKELPVAYDPELAAAWQETHHDLPSLLPQGRPRYVLGRVDLVVDADSGMPLFYRYGNPALGRIENLLRGLGEMPRDRLDFVDRAGRVVGRIENLEVPVAETETARDPWKHRSERMKCATCMFYVPKIVVGAVGGIGPREVGRCRRHAPTMAGYPAVFPDDWCGDHKLDEEKA